jgi:hypothetical protein
MGGHASFREFGCLSEIPGQSQLWHGFSEGASGARVGSIDGSPENRMIKVADPLHPITVQDYLTIVLPLSDR